MQLLQSDSRWWIAGRISETPIIHVMLRIIKPAKCRGSRPSRLISRSCRTVCTLGINTCHRCGCYRGLWKRLAIGNGILRTCLTMKLGRPLASSYVDTWEKTISPLILDYMNKRPHWGYEEWNTCCTIKITLADRHEFRNKELGLNITMICRAPLRTHLQNSWLNVHAIRQRLAYDTTWHILTNPGKPILSSTCMN